MDPSCSLRSKYQAAAGRYIALEAPSRLADQEGLGHPVLRHTREVLLVPKEEHRKDMITVLYKQIYAVTKTKHAIISMFFLLIND